MGFLSTTILQQLGLGYSIVGIALVVPICFGFRQYMRFLDHLQIFYLLFLGLASSSTSIFSGYLDESWVLFPRNFYVFCTTGDLVCTVGFPLSFTSCLIGFLLIVKIVVAIEQCRKKELRFEPVYVFFKGFFRWTFLALFYYSLIYLVKSIKQTKDDLIPSIVILSVTTLFPFFQLIAYKCIQTQEINIWRKWLQFFSYIRLMLIALLVAFAKTQNTTRPYYFIYGIYILYIVVYAWKYPFVFKIGGRIIFILGQLCAVVISFFFIFELTLLQKYHIDFCFVSGMLLLDVGHYIALIIYFCKYGFPKDNQQKVSPDSEQSRQQIEVNKNKSMDVEEIQLYQPKKNKRDSGYNDLDQTKEYSGNQARRRRRL